jgi:hypothetical protein
MNMFLMVLSLTLYVSDESTLGHHCFREIPISSVSISPLADLPKSQPRKYEGTCPSCNTYKKLTHSLNRAVAVAILAVAAAFLQ